jgi:hypothetical protein
LARAYLEKPFRKIGLVEWLKVKAPGSSPSTGKTKNKNKTLLSGGYSGTCYNRLKWVNSLRKWRLVEMNSGARLPGL